MSTGRSRRLSRPVGYLHSNLHSAAYILNPRYHHTHDFSSGTGIQQHDALLQKWISEEDLHTYKADCSNKEKTHVFSTQTLWTEKALEVDAHVWWDYWGSGKKEVLHDFATRVTASRPRSVQRSDV